MQALIAPLNELAEFEELHKNRTKERGMIRVCGCVNSQKTHMMYALSDGLKYKVIACSSELKAKQIYEEYRFLDPYTYLYPAKDLLFYQADLRSKELLRQRMEVLQALMEGKPMTVVTSFDAFLDSLIPKEVIGERFLHIKNDSALDLGDMQKKLADLGYDREVQIEGIGQFAVRNGMQIEKTNENLRKMIEYMRKGDSEQSFAILKTDHFETGRNSALKAESIEHIQ